MVSIGLAAMAPDRQGFSAGTCGIINQLSKRLCNLQLTKLNLLQRCDDVDLAERLLGSEAVLVLVLGATFMRGG